jgi:hypothetical protein
VKQVRVEGHRRIRFCAGVCRNSKGVIGQRRQYLTHLCLFKRLCICATGRQVKILDALWGRTSFLRAFHTITRQPLRAFDSGLGTLLKDDGRCQRFQNHFKEIKSCQRLPCSCSTGFEIVRRATELRMSSYISKHPAQYGLCRGTARRGNRNAALSGLPCRALTFLRPFLDGFFPYYK